MSRQLQTQLFVGWFIMGKKRWRLFKSDRLSPRNKQLPRQQGRCGKFHIILSTTCIQKFILGSQVLDCEFVPVCDRVAYGLCKHMFPWQSIRRCFPCRISLQAPVVAVEIPASNMRSVSQLLQQGKIQSLMKGIEPPPPPTHPHREPNT